MTRCPDAPIAHHAHAFSHRVTGLSVAWRLTGALVVYNNSGMKMQGIFRPRRSLACWVDFLVCPRRYLAILPSHARANLFAGD